MLCFLVFSPRKHPAQRRRFCPGITSGKAFGRGMLTDSLIPGSLTGINHFPKSNLPSTAPATAPKSILRRRLEVVGLLQSQGGTSEHRECRPTNFQLSHGRAGASLLPPYKNSSPRRVRIIQPFLTLSHPPTPPAISDRIASKPELSPATDRFAGFSEPGPRFPGRFACRCGGNAICSWRLPILVYAAFCSAIALSSGWATCREIPAEAEIITTYASHLVMPVI